MQRALLLPKTELHLLPADALAAILQRVHARELILLGRVPCHAIYAASLADHHWSQTLKVTFGKALCLRVQCILAHHGQSDGAEEFEDAKEIQTDTSEDTEEETQQALAAVARPARAAPSEETADEHSESAERDETLDVPTWLRDFYFPGDAIWISQQQSLRHCSRAWRRSKTFRTAYLICGLLIPPSFATDPERWSVNLTNGESDEQAKACVLADFCLINTRRWAACRDREAFDIRALAKVAGALSHFITTPKSQEGGSLAAATCRLYIYSFDLKDMDLVPALRIFMHQVFNIYTRTHASKDTRARAHTLSLTHTLSHTCTHTRMHLPTHQPTHPH